MPEIKDIREISQDHRTFTARQASDFNRLDPELQKKADTFHNLMFFSPWYQNASRYSLDELKWEFEKYGKNPGYGKKGNKHSASWIKALDANALLKDYPNGGFPAITVQNTSLRVLPTFDVHLNSPQSRSLPFDNLQNSGVAANTPIYISHISEDKRWVLAETHYAIGWIHFEHIAHVDQNFIKEWQTGAYATVIKDKTPIYDEKEKLLFKSPLGSFFPKIGEDNQSLRILTATADNHQKAVIKQAIISTKVAATKPLPLTTDNMSGLANELMHEPYGWGGLDQKRDCSSTLMDLFAPFGIWLPRNSRHQAKMAGAFIDLNGLSPEEKENAILKQGMPYFTLLWLKGHIMLYIGNHEGRALIFHNFLTVKTRDSNGKTGKKFIGRAAITTLYPGQELRHGNGPGDILPSIRGMTLIWPPVVSKASSPPQEENNQQKGCIDGNCNYEKSSKTD